MSISFTRAMNRFEQAVRQHEVDPGDNHEEAVERLKRARKDLRDAFDKKKTTTK